jgi:hypothetical protein
VSLPSPFGAGKPNPSTSTTDPLIQALARLLAEGRLALRPRNAARALNISQRTLWAITAPRGDLPAARLGPGRSAVVYPLIDMICWLSRRAAEGVRDATN